MNEYSPRKEGGRGNNLWFSNGSAGDGGGGETIFEFSNKAKYDYILENEIAIRNQIKIIKLHSPKKKQKKDI